MFRSFVFVGFCNPPNLILESTSSVDSFLHLNEPSISPHLVSQCPLSCLCPYGLPATYPFYTFWVTCQVGISLLCPLGSQPHRHTPCNALQSPTKWAVLSTKTLTPLQLFSPLPALTTNLSPCTQRHHRAPCLVYFYYESHARKLPLALPGPHQVETDSSPL